MNSERRLAVLEAFVQTKPTEFDAFVLRWEKENPEPTIVKSVEPTKSLESSETIESPQPSEDTHKARRKKE